MTEQHRTDDRPSSGIPGVALGAILIIVGILLFAAQVVDLDLGWPLWVIGVGVAILLVGFLILTEPPIVVGGTVVTTVGLVLAYQEATGHWESWAYAWALVGPAASGLGMALWSMRNGNAAGVRAGTWGMLGGVGLFAVGFLFFEGVIGISGRRLPLPEWTLPAAIIAIGAVMLLRGLLSREQPRAGTR